MKREREFFIGTLFVNHYTVVHLQIKACYTAVRSLSRGLVSLSLSWVVGPRQVRPKRALLLVLLSGDRKGPLFF